MGNIERELELMERDERALERIADALTAWVKIQQAIFDKQYPEKPKRAGEVNRSSDERNQQFSDKPESEWIEETERALPSRFQKRFDDQQKGSSSPKVPKGN